MQQGFSLYVKVDIVRQWLDLPEYRFKFGRTHCVNRTVIAGAEGTGKIALICDFDINTFDHEHIIMDSVSVHRREKRRLL